MNINLSDQTLLAIDCGGTGSKAVCCKGDRFEEAPLPGAANYWAVGADGIAKVWRRAREHFNLGSDEAALTLVVVAGLELPEDQQNIQRALFDQGHRGKAIVENDTDAGLLTLAGKEHRIALICGTGANCVGKTSRFPNARFQRGGTYYLVSDRDAGGVGIGLKAYRFAMTENDTWRNGAQIDFAANEHGHDRIERYIDEHGSPLLRCVREHLFKELQISNLKASVPLLHGMENDRLVRIMSELAPSIFSVANDGDEVAREILYETGRGLSELLLGVLTEAQMQSADVANLGSIINLPGNQNPVADEFNRRVMAQSGFDLRFHRLPAMAALRSAVKNAAAAG